MDYYISLDRVEFRKTGDLSVTCTCGFTEKTEDNSIRAAYHIVRRHVDETQHVLLMQDLS